MHGKREFGDYQTPIDFAEQVCNYLHNFRQISPSAVVEPTCGLGNFLKSSLLFNANEYYGIEINPDYCFECTETIHDNRVKIINSDFFTVNFLKINSRSEKWLIYLIFSGFVPTDRELINSL